MNNGYPDKIQIVEVFNGHVSCTENHQFNTKKRRQAFSPLNTSSSYILDLRSSEQESNKKTWRSADLQIQN